MNFLFGNAAKLYCTCIYMIKHLISKGVEFSKIKLMKIEKANEYLCLLEYMFLAGTSIFCSPFIEAVFAEWGETGDYCISIHFCTLCAR